MKSITIFLLAFVFLIACSQRVDKEKLKQEVYQAEKEFEKMCADKGIAEAFYFFASDSAVIKRQNDTLIIGRESIRDYYNKPVYKKAAVSWTPDFIDVSDCGDLSYTFGKYLWKVWDDKGDTTEYRGVFHTVWKRESDGIWNYVWD
jgi:ketosteroid isomerase-like protein